MLILCKSGRHILGLKYVPDPRKLTSDGRCKACRHESHNRANAAYRARSKGLLNEAMRVGARREERHGW